MSRWRPLSFVLVLLGLACSPTVGGVKNGHGSDGGSVLLPDAGGPVDAGYTGLYADGGVIGTPIKYVLVIVKENHTFDNYFAGFPGADSSLTAKLSDGGMIVRPRGPDGAMARDLCHAQSCASLAYHDGGMDGLDLVGGTSVNDDMLAYIHYTEDQIPNYWTYARNFVLADHVFSTTFGPSFPGHFAIAAGYNFSLANPTCSCGGSCTVSSYDPATCAKVDVKPCWDTPSIVQELPAGFTWKEYGWATLESIQAVHDMGNYSKYFAPWTQVLTDVQNNTMPNLMIAHQTSGNSEHPPAAICTGENQSVQLINAAMQNPHWKEMAVILLWDDYGGFYDSVDPQPPQCPNGDFMRPGFRIPLLVISPYSKKGYVLKDRGEQASIIKLVEDLWHLPRMGTKDARVRDVTAGSLLNAFDFGQTAREPMILDYRTCP